MTKSIKTPIGRLVFNNPALLNERKKTINEQYGKMARKMDLNNLYPPGVYGKLTAKQFTIDDAAAVTEAARFIMGELVKEMAHYMARVVMINAASEKAAQCAADAMSWRDMIKPGSHPDRNQTRLLIAAAFQRDAATYYRLAIDLRLSLR